MQNVGFFKGFPATMWFGRCDTFVFFFKTLGVDWLSSMRVSVGLGLAEGGGKESM